MSTFLVALIVACEVGFWPLLARAWRPYVLRWPRAGAILLVAAPVVDLVLLVAAVADLRSGAPPAAADARVDWCPNALRTTGNTLAG